MIVSALPSLETTRRVAAKSGGCGIVTSALTLVEIAKLKGLTATDEDKEALIEKAFENEYISVRNVDRFVAERARHIVRKCAVEPPDAIHLATAILMDAHVMQTFDNGLIKLTGLDELGGLRIEEPEV